jgi:hypothetical protein
MYNVKRVITFGKAYRGHAEDNFAQSCLRLTGIELRLVSDGLIGRLLRWQITGLRGLIRIRFLQNRLCKETHRRQSVPDTLCSSERMLLEYYHSQRGKLLVPEEALVAF